MSSPRGAGICRLLRAVSLSALAAGIVSELLHDLASRSCPDKVSPSRSAGLIVLGCPTTRLGRLSAMQRWRVEIAARSLPGLSARRDPVRVVFTGAAWKKGRREAEAMAGYARRLGVPDEAIVVESTSTSTWENIERALEVVGDLDQLAVVSDPLHAFRGRRYLRRQRPDLAGRLVGVDDYRLLEHPVLKVSSIAYELPRVAWIRWRQLLRLGR